MSSPPVTTKSLLAQSAAGALILALGGCNAALDAPEALGSAAEAEVFNENGPNPSTVHFIESAVENADRTEATFPLYFAHRTGAGLEAAIGLVITDASTPEMAAALGVNYAPKLKNAVGTAAVQQGTFSGPGSQVDRASVIAGLRQGRLRVAHTVDFHAATRAVTRGVALDYFPPAVAIPGAVGDDLYTPLVQLPDGTVINAPHVSNRTGRADKVNGLTQLGDRPAVRYRETAGFYDNGEVRYVSFEASNPVAAALEDVTYAPAMNAAPTLGDESDSSSREGLIAFTNGQIGVGNPERQGLSSAIHDGLAPLNILHEVPEAGSFDYSPLWDVRFAAWTAAAVTQGANTHQRDFSAVLDRVSAGLVTGPNGAPFGAAGIVVNCPPVTFRPAP
jgi:hypothetical protein